MKQHLKSLKLAGVLWVIELSASGLYADLNLNVGTVNGEAGSEVVVPILLEGGGDVTAVQFTLMFDDEYLSLADRTAVIGGDLLADHTVRFRTRAGEVTVTILSGTLSTLGQDAGLLAQIRPDKSNILLEGPEAFSSEKARSKKK